MQADFLICSSGYLIKIRDFFSSKAVENEKDILQQKIPTVVKFNDLMVHRYTCIQ